MGKTIKVTAKPYEGCLQFRVREERYYTWEPYRIFVQNGDEVVVVRPAKGSFRNGYDYLFKWALRGDGPKAIQETFEASTRMNPFGRSYEEMAQELYKFTKRLRS